MKLVNLLWGTSTPAPAPAPAPKPMTTYLSQQPQQPQQLQSPQPQPLSYDLPYKLPYDSIHGLKKIIFTVFADTLTSTIIQLEYPEPIPFLDHSIIKVNNTIIALIDETKSQASVYYFVYNMLFSIMWYNTTTTSLKQPTTLLPAPIGLDNIKVILCCHGKHRITMLQTILATVGTELGEYKLIYSKKVISLGDIIRMLSASSLNVKEKEKEKEKEILKDSP